MSHTENQSGFRLWLKSLLTAIFLSVAAIAGGHGLAYAAEAVDEHSASYQAGLGERAIWESWFTGLAGETRAGAAYWAEQRSAAEPRSCRAEAAWIASGAENWVNGCLDAKQNLDPSDVRRKTDIQYRYGWNRLTLTAWTYSRIPAANHEQPNAESAGEKQPLHAVQAASEMPSAMVHSRNPLPDALSGRDVNRLKTEFDDNAGSFMSRYVAKSRFSDIGVFQEFAATAMPASSKTLWMLVVNLPHARVTCFKDHPDPDLELLRRGQPVRVEGLIGIPMAGGIILASEGCSADSHWDKAGTAVGATILD